MSEHIDLSRRRILATLGTVGVASAGAGLSTSAFFSDQETFENNRLVAGTLDVGVGYTAHYSDWSDDEDDGLDGSVRMFEGGPDEVGRVDELAADEVGLPTNDAWLVAVDEGDVGAFLENTQTGAYPNVGTDADPEQGPVTCVDGAAMPQADDAPRPVIELTDVKPGDFGEVTFDFVLCDNPGYVWLTGALRAASENGTTEPEADDPDEESGVVELLDTIRAALWVDDGGDGPGGNADGNNFQNADETPLVVGTLRDVLGVGAGGSGAVLNAGLNGDLPAAQGGGTGRNCFSAETTHSLVFAWWLPVDHGNEVQSDGVRFDLGLYAEQCRHNDGVREAEFPRAVAESFLAATDVGEDDAVFFAGPVDPGMVLRDLDGTELTLPTDPGTYYVFVVDEQPTAGFAHSLRFAWLDTDSGATDEVDAAWWPQFGTVPQFEFPGTPTTVQGRSFFFGTEPSGSPSALETPSDGQLLDGDTGVCLPIADDEPVGALGDGERDQQADDEPCIPLQNVPTTETNFAEQLNYALVLDGGLWRDERGNANLWNSDTMAGWAAEVESWLEGENYLVQRISQLHGTAPGVPAGQDPPELPGPFETQPNQDGSGHVPSPAYDQLEAVFGQYASAFASASRGELGPTTIHFVLVVIAHGHPNHNPSKTPPDEESDEDDAFFIMADPGKPTTPNGQGAFIPWTSQSIVRPWGTIGYDAGVKQWLAAFPNDKVSITVIALSCWSGEGEMVVDDVVEWVVASAGVDSTTSARSVKDFLGDRPDLGEMYDALHAPKVRHPDQGNLGPLDS